jgi:GNAT superfamily N-acetyltransferase
MRLPLRGPELLTGDHDVSEFNCGNEALNRFLQRYALPNQRNQSARTYVALRGENRVIGYYSLAAASAEYETVPARIAKGLAQNPIPLTLLARLALDQEEQGAGIGAGLLKDALKRFLQAQSIIAARALVVHAKDAQAVEFYQHFGFVPSPLDPYHLYLMTKDVHECLA